jgi:hypothetical protein
MESTNSEVKSNIGSLYSGKTAAWDFEGSIDYSLLSGTANESAEIVESGIVVDFNIEDIEDFSIVETIEGSPITRTVQTRYGTEEIVLEPIKTITRTETLLTPSNINYIYYSGKGRKYAAYIDADNRGNGESGDNGYAENALIENPIYIIEDILRDELSMSSTNIDFATFDTSGNTTNGLLGDIYEDAISDIKFAFSQFKFMNSKSFIERLCKLCFSYVFIGGDGKFKIKTLRRSDDYSSADETIDYRDLSNVKIAKTPLDAVKNSILIKYKHDYGGQQNKSEATATDSTSQGTTVNGFNQVLKLQIEANEILDDTTATKLAEAYLHLLKDRKNKISFSTSRPRYNHLEIGDIINFSNWPSEFKLYGQTLGGSFDSTTTTFDSTTTTFENTAAGYYMITDIAKNINSSNIEAIRVS